MQGPPQVGAARRRTVLTAVAVCAVATALSGCSGSTPDSAVYEAPAPAPAPSVVLDPYSGPVGALDGRPASTGVATRQVVVVPFAVGRPAQGLDAADLVVVEASPGRSRTIGLYQSQLPTSVGPVGALRPNDAKLGATVHALVASDGSSSKFVPLLAPLGVVDASAAAAARAYRRATAGRMVDLVRLEHDFGRSRSVSSLLTFERGDDTFASEGADAVTQLHLAMGERAWSWSYDRAQDQWSPGPGAPCPASASVVVQQVPFKSLRVDKTGTTEPAAQLLGRGRASVVSGPLGVTATWSRPANDALTNYADPTGTPIRLRPGRTCLVLVPTGSDVEMVQ